LHFSSHILSLSLISSQDSFNGALIPHLCALCLRLFVILIFPCV
jgi:hypothetical protein